MKEDSSKKDLRGKLEDFFNPGPSSNSKSRDVEDQHDAYDHTKQFFSKSQAVDKVDIGERKIKGDIDLDDLVYGGKKVSREQLEIDLDDEDESDDDMSQDDEEGLEDDDQYSDEQKAEQSDENEDQSEGFEEDEKVENDEAEDDENMEDLTKQIKDKEMLDVLEDENDQDLDIALKQLKEEDKNDQEFVQQKRSTDVQKGKSVRTQKKLFDNFLHQRIIMQKLLTSANKLPQSAEIMQQFADSNKNIESGIQECRRKLKGYTKDAIQLQKKLFDISQTTIQYQEIKNEDVEDIDIQQLWQNIDQNFSNMLPFVEETIDRWNSRTMIVKNLNNNQNNHRNKTFNRTILDQVNQYINDEESKQKMIEKTQLKRDAYKIFGMFHDNLTQERDPNIYNDFDFYQTLLKDFLEMNDHSTNDLYNNEENGAEVDNDNYLDGADIGLTQKFLLKRQKLRESQDPKKKEVDRKASKNRKIRYTVHEKIVNFMAPLENLNLQEAKESILTSLFGKTVTHVINNKEPKNNQKSSAKNGKKEGKQSGQDIDGVKLL